MKNWFYHDSDAWMDTKMMDLRAKHGLAGYGFFWAVVELLRASSDGKISNDETILSKFLGVSVALAKQMLNTCLANGLLLLTDDNRIYSKSLNNRLERYNSICEKRRVAGSLGGKAKVALAKRSDLNRSDLNRSDLKRESAQSAQERNRVAVAPRITMTKEESDELYAQYGDLYTEELAKASDWTLAKGKSHKDAAAFMRNWMRRAAAQSRLAASSVCPPKDFKTIEHEARQERERLAVEAVVEFNKLYPKTKRLNS